MAFLIKIFGDSQYPFRAYNVLMAAILVCGLLGIAKQFSNSNRTRLVSSILTLCFYPIIVYTCLLYGTLAAAAWEAIGFYFVLKYSDSFSFRYGIAASLCFTFGVFMHQSALIGMIASSIYLLLKLEKKNWYKTIAVIMLMFAVYLFSASITNKVYDEITDAPDWDSMPASVWIYMGLTADGNLRGGPGSQNGINAYLFEAYDADAELTNQAVKRNLKIVISDYLNGTRDLSFFVRKTQFQWLDPSFDAHKLIYLVSAPDDSGNNPQYVSFYYSKLRTTIFKLGISLMIMIYGLSMFSGIHSLITKKEVDVHFLIQIFFIGGFAFQLIWESSSRYTFSYYTMLIIEATYGISIIGNSVNAHRNIT